MNWVIQHPNGEYVTSNYHGRYDTSPFMRHAKRYSRLVAKQQAGRLIGGKAIRYDGYEAQAQIDRLFPPEFGEVKS